MKRYFIDSTLLNYQLISLYKFDVRPLPRQLEKDQDITIKLYIDNDNVYSFENCHIDNTDDRRLRVPSEVMIWLRQTYAFSVAYFAAQHDKSRAGIWKNEDIKRFDKAFCENSVKMDVPGETILLSWISNQDSSYLEIREGFKITHENATKYLSEKALASVLPYILSSVKNTSITDTQPKGNKCYIIDRTTDWLSVDQYCATQFSHPGLYLLRRKIDNGEFAYYIGKANDIKNRIIKNKAHISHPDEKEDGNKQYDEIACIAVNFDDYKRLYGELNNNDETAMNNTGVKRGSDTDNALYAIEDIAIHVAAMVLQGEGKILDNKQYRSYTSQWLRKI